MKDVRLGVRWPDRLLVLASGRRGLRARADPADRVRRRDAAAPAAWPEPPHTPRRGLSGNLQVFYGRTRFFTRSASGHFYLTM